MEIGKPAPIRRPIALTPLVDIVFLLLMFFLLSSTFTKFGQTNVSSGSTQNAAATPAGFPGVIIAVAVPNSVTVNGQYVALKDLAPLLNDFLAKGVKLAVLRVAKSATVQDLVTALEAARSSRISDIRVVE